MKKIVMSFLCISSCINAISIGFHSECDSCECKTTSHTFFNIESPFRWVSPERLANYHDRFDAHCDDYWNAAFQAVPLGGQSTHNSRIAKFFLPSCKDTLIVAEQQSQNPDILANELNIYTQEGNFLSKVTFNPQHTFAGVGFTYQQAFYRRCNGSLFYVALSGPFLSVRNQMSICEKIIQPGEPLTSVQARSQRNCSQGSCTDPISSCACNNGCDINNLDPLPVVTSVKQAFAQPGWCFGKINECVHKKIAFADLNVIIGYQAVNNCDYYLDSFFGAILPTGNKPTAQFVFEPMVGHNNHYGIIVGNSLGLRVYDSDCYDLHARIAIDFDIEYFFARNELRSFDLKNKPWSRYMQLYGSHEQAQLAFDSQTSDPILALTVSTPGINILTQNVEVKPGFSRSFNIAYIVDYCDINLEGGYNFFARQAECIKLNCKLPKGIAIKSLQGSGKTNIVGQINNSFNQCTATSFDDYSINTITHHDLDLNSAAHPCVLSHQFYGSACYGWVMCQTNMFGALGGSYEFSPNNNGISRWMAWGKLGFAF